MYEKRAVKDYVIDSTVNVGPTQGDDNSSDRLATTSGGSGSSADNCCRITTGIKADTKYFFIATEDWTEPAFSNGRHMYLCGGSQSGMRAPDCTNTSSVPIPQITNNQQGIPISWHVDFKTMPGHVIYSGRLDNKAGCGPGNIGSVADPKYKNGQVIMPNVFGPVKVAHDPTRIRADGLGSDIRYMNAMGIAE